MSTCQAPNPRSTLRPKFPCCPAGAAVNAARLKILPPGYCGPKSSRGTPGFKFGREARVTPPTLEVAPITSTGGADLARMKVSNDQPTNLVCRLLLEKKKKTKQPTKLKLNKYKKYIE